ncbi:MAG: ribosome assembly factor SBDS [Candidatus Thermoplasmatota archaeon]
MPVSLDKAVVARLPRFNLHFEILVDPDAAVAVAEHFRRGEAVSDDTIRALCPTDTVFTHWSDGKRASREELLKGFETEEFVTIASRILREGEIQLTAEQRKKMADAKHKRIVETILRNAWNPQTKTPHPKERIERALEEAKFKVDPMRRVEEQVEEAMKKLRLLLPIAFDKVKVAIRIPSEHAGHAYGSVRGLGELQQEEWQSDGSLVVVLELPAGMQTDLYDRLNSMTHGKVTVKLLGK